MPAPISPWPQTQPERIPSDGWLRDRFLSDPTAAGKEATVSATSAVHTPTHLKWYEKYYTMAEPH